MSDAISDYNASIIINEEMYSTNFDKIIQLDLDLPIDSLDSMKIIINNINF